MLGVEALPRVARRRPDRVRHRGLGDAHGRRRERRRDLRRHLLKRPSAADHDPPRPLRQDPPDSRRRGPRPQARRPRSGAARVLRVPEPRRRDAATGPTTPPRSKALGEKAPLVVMLYGGPHVQYVTDSWAMTADLRAQYFTQRGFAVWKMDNRGSARRGHAFEAALHRNMGSVEVRDQVDGVKFVAAKRARDRYGARRRQRPELRRLHDAPLPDRGPRRLPRGRRRAPPSPTGTATTSDYTERYMGTPEKNTEGYRGPRSSRGSATSRGSCSSSTA